MGSNEEKAGGNMIQKLSMKLCSTLRWLLSAGVILFVLCLVCGFLYDDLENRTLFWGLGGGGLALAAVVWVGFKLGNRSKYQKLCDKLGEHGIQMLVEEYQKGERTKEAVFGSTHLFVEPGCNTVGFDQFAYSQIFWMHLYQHVTNYSFIPILHSWSIRIYIDDPARGRQQMVEINARRFHKNPKEFFNRVIAKNPNIVLGFNPDWARMHDKDKETFIQFARSQQQVLE